MNTVDYILIALIAVWVIASVIIIIKSVKKGKCVGCPYSGECSAKRKDKNSADCKKQGR